MGCGLWLLLLPPLAAAFFLSKAWQRATLSLLVSSRENLLRASGSELLLKYAAFRMGLCSLQACDASADSAERSLRCFAAC